MPATDASRPRPSHALTHRDLDDELLFYDGSGDQVHVLNGTARDIYMLCDGSRTAGQIADQLCQEYDVDRDTAAADVRATVDRLAALGIVEL